MKMSKDLSDGLVNPPESSLIREVGRRETQPPKSSAVLDASSVAELSGRATERHRFVTSDDIAVMVRLKRPRRLRERISNGGGQQ